MENKDKIKYLLETLAFTTLFFIFVAPAIASEITPENIMEHVNQSRESQGLADLIVNSKLAAVAQDKLNDMIKNHYFAHTSPKGIDPWHWFTKNEYDYQYAGENLALDFLTAEEQHKAWMDSQTHRKNILNPNYREIGVAVGAGEINGKTSIIAVQEFGSLIASAYSSQNFSSQPNPQTLATKSLGLESSNVNLTPIPPVQKGDMAWDILTAIIDLVFLATLALAPMAFMAVAFEKMIILRTSSAASTAVE